MQNGTVHYDRPCADLNPLRACMQVRSIIYIGTMPKFDLISKAYAHIIFNSCKSIHFQNQFVKNTADRDPKNRGDPTEQGNEELLVKITKYGRCLTAQVQLDVCQHNFYSCKLACSAIPT